MDRGIERVDSSSEGLQEWHNDFDDWICKFEARLVSRSSKNLESPTSIAELNANFTPRTNLEKAKPPPTSLSLQETIVDGFLIAQKRKEPTSIGNCFNLFKKNEDFAHYDYVLLKLVNENGRNNLYKYIRSKL